MKTRKYTQHVSETQHRSNQSLNLVREISLNDNNSKPTQWNKCRKVNKRVARKKNPHSKYLIIHIFRELGWEENMKKIIIKELSFLRSLVVNTYLNKDVFVDLSIYRYCCFP